MDLFEEISKAKRELPNANKLTHDVENYSLNFYQLFAIGLFIVSIGLGVVFGNLFATCEASSYFYANACVVKQFNFSLMLLIWFVGALIGLFIFAIGHIISLLLKINEKLDKFKL